MVKSKLNDTVNYPEIKYISEEDKDYEANLYEMNLFDITSVIAIGLPKFSFLDANIVYYPVYIIKNDTVVSQIGLYEIMSNQQPSILDDDGDVDIDKLGSILLFSYVNEDYLRNIVGVNKGTEPHLDDPEESDSDGDSDDDDSDNDEDDSDSDEDLSYKLQSDLEIKQYSKHKNEDWIETYMKNNNYRIVENEGGGDCLFASIRDGLRRIGKMITVKDLRKKLADNATEEVFQEFRNMQVMLHDELVSINADIKTREKEFKELIHRGKKTKDRDMLYALTTQAKELKEIHEITKKSKANTSEMANEYKFMEGVTSLDEFKTKIQSCDFWGETWAISTLERIFNIKLILFSREAYTSNDMDNVILCNQLNDTVLQEAGVFNPSHYILLEYIGYHYRLITYKGHGALSFNEIPYEVKRKILDKCLEKNAGVFYLIPEFREFMKNKDGDIPYKQEIEDHFDTNATNLYDPYTIFQFYYASAGGPAPGKGAGEEINKENLFNFNELSAIPNWRRKLDNYWHQPFQLDDHTWNTVEHYYQASKFKENNPQFYITFASDVNPEGELSQQPSVAKSAGSISGKYKGKLIRPSTIHIDPNFYGGREKKVMQKALMAKFSQHEELKQILMLTKDAKLQRFVRGSPPKILESLMMVRKDLLNNK